MSDTVCAACFDLEQILLTPKSFESSLYYKRRLSTYNFTIYDLGKKDGFCYTWNETVAKRGSSEVASCILSFIAQKSKEGFSEFIFYSDNCLGQNKNRQYVTMLWYCLHHYDVARITHQYLEKGHIFNKHYSIYSFIETISRHGKYLFPSQRVATIRAVRHRTPYQVKDMG